ncbi:hypothetical protein TNCV_1364241 [Trichonephila clavipes]|uniref:Uncharacterized protein n=1 Tax=Trichonephila clavipes TaxID=2585209 RepID=A0A8X6RTZ1_TRICX|nr:hypothetical protein TNCV_1364241 [Trichonephila clavipes]
MWNPQKAGYLLRNILGSKVVKTNLKEDFHINYSVTSKWFTLIFCYFFIKDSSDEAHFWLNGYVNKQNCRIWSEANPQVYVETPLHPEKLTVWCALWAGGILLQKR